MKPAIDFAPIATADHPQLWSTTALTHVGWYPVDGECEHAMQRFWHGPGRGWSAPCYDDDPEHIKMRAGSTPAESQDGIEWRTKASVCRIAAEAEREGSAT